jgi:hypothetical protein
MLNNAQYTLFCTSPPLVINAAFKVDFTEDVEKVVLNLVLFVAEEIV